MNVRVPRYLRDTVDERRQPLGLSRDTWVVRALTWALVYPGPKAVLTAPGKRTVPPPANGVYRPFGNRVEFHRDPLGDWHWCFRAAETGDVLGQSARGWPELRDCRNAIHRILLANDTSPVEFTTRPEETSHAV